MDASNKVIQSFWTGKPLSSMEKMSMLSFLKHGHEYHLYTYGPIDVPSGVQVKDANEIIPKSLLDHSKFKKIALFADYFRYRLLTLKGGWWVDTDVICMKPFNFEEEYVFASEVQEAKTWVNNGIIKAPKDSPVMKHCWEQCVAKVPENIKWAETGPRLLTEEVKAFHMWSMVKPEVTFCPIKWTETDKFIRADVDLVIPDAAYAVHLWNEVWSASKYDKEKFPTRTFYSQLRSKYLVTQSPDMSDVTAIIKTFLRDKCLYHCVKTLKECYPSIHVIVADDGHCSEEKRETLTELGVEQYIELPWNRGLSHGRNVLLDACKTPYVLLCDDDFSFTLDCKLENLRKLMGVADIAGGLVYNLRNWTLSPNGKGWDVTGGNFTKKDVGYIITAPNQFKLYTGIRYEDSDFILNFFIAKTDKLRQVKWDPSLQITYEHIDFALRAKQMGLKSIRTRDAFVFHKELIETNDPQYLEIRGNYDKYRKIFEAKWGFPQPEHEKPLRPINEPIPQEPVGFRETADKPNPNRYVGPGPKVFQFGRVIKKV